jgi:hypothetical protein
MSRTILIDYESNRFKVNGVVPEKSHNCDRAVVVSIPLHVYEKLRDKSPTSVEDKLALVEASAKRVAFGFYDVNKKVACIPNTEGMSYEFVHDDPSIAYWVCVPLGRDSWSDRLNELVAHGFGSPYITNQDPKGNPIPLGLAMSTVHKHTDPGSVVRECEYVISQYGSEYCKMHCALTEDAVNFLRSLSHSGHTKNGDGSVSQKEVAGVLHVEKVVDCYSADKCAPGDVVFIIGVDTKTIEHGGEEDVDIAPSRYNFHSHPKEAYVRHSVHTAWPSNTDYLGVLQLQESTIFHCVATLEGLYVISFENRIENTEANRKEVRAKFKLEHTLALTPSEYIARVNRLKINGVVVYNVKYFKWDSAQSIFGIKYGKDGHNCFANSKTIENYGEFHVRT